MQSIAAAAGVAKATLYNHFRTKDEVAAALLARRAGPAGRAGRDDCPWIRRWPRSPTSSGRIRVLRRLAEARARDCSPRCWPSTASGGRSSLRDWPRRSGSTTTARSWPPAGCSASSLQPGRSTTRHRHAAPAGRGAWARRRRSWTLRPAQSDRVSTIRSRPGRRGPSTGVRSRPSAVWKASAAALSGRVTACTTRAPVLHRPGRRTTRTVAGRARTAGGRRARRAGAGTRGGRRSRRPARSRRPLRRVLASAPKPPNWWNQTGWCSARVSAVPEPVVRVEQSRADRGGGQLGEADEVGVVRFGHRVGPGGVELRAGRRVGADPRAVERGDERGVVDEAQQAPRRAASSSAGRSVTPAVEQPAEQARGEGVAGADGVDDVDARRAPVQQRRGPGGRSAAGRRRR